MQFNVCTKHTSMLNMYGTDVVQTWKIRINKSVFSISVLPYKITIQ